MTDHLITSVVSIAVAIVGIAVLAVLVSQRAQTSQVITSAGNAFATDLEAAVSPVTGQMPNTSSGFSGFTGGGSAGMPSIY